MIAIFMAASALMATSCSEDDVSDPINPVGDTITYELNTISNSDISGTATFIRNEDNSTTITMELVGASAGAVYPAHIHLNTAIETGKIVITLNPVDGASATSTTTVSTLDDGTPITYTDLLEFDGYLNVHLSAEEPEILVAQVDIGRNELTGESITYELHEKDVPGITGTAIFEKRKSGETLATLTVAPTNDGEMHPAHIHRNTAVETGGIAFTFNPINGTTGKSVTNIAALDDGTAISFQELMNFDGYLNVHLSTDDLGTIIAQSDIGQNELTGETKTYTLNAVTDPTISGSTVFAERLNGEILVSIQLEGTSDGNTHPAHIHVGDVASAPGNIAITLNNVDGETGTSSTNISEFDAGGAVNYDGLIDFDGYISVHQSPIDMDVIIAQGNIGANVE